MIGATIVFIVAVSLVATYMLLVNRNLRQDEHWAEMDLPKSEPTVVPVRVGTLAKA